MCRSCKCVSNAGCTCAPKERLRLCTAQALISSVLLHGFHGLLHGRRRCSRCSRRLLHRLLHGLRLHGLHGLSRYSALHMPGTKLNAHAQSNERPDRWMNGQTNKSINIECVTYPAKNNKKNKKQQQSHRIGWKLWHSEAGKQQQQQQAEARQQCHQTRNAETQSLDASSTSKKLIQNENKGRRVEASLPSWQPSWPSSSRPCWRSEELAVDRRDMSHGM